MGFHLAGFDVVGVDNKPQPRYPFEFHQDDAVQFILKHGHEFDFIHASPPCQEYSVTASLKRGSYPKLIEPTRDALIKAGRPYDIENVPGAPLKNPLLLCGTMFGLRVIRHRLFECSWGLMLSPMSCNHNGTVSGNRNIKGLRKTLANFQYLTIVGNDYIVEDGKKAMGIDWMIRKELSQAIPPAFTEYVGRAFLGNHALLSNNGLQRTSLPLSR